MAKSLRLDRYWTEGQAKIEKGKKRFQQKKKNPKQNNKYSYLIIEYGIICMSFGNQDFFPHNFPWINRIIFPLPQGNTLKASMLSTFTECLI